jgi:hypothetical protein
MKNIHAMSMETLKTKACRISLMPLQQINKLLASTVSTSYQEGCLPVRKNCPLGGSKKTNADAGELHFC